MRVALVGAGSLGTITGALMSKNGVDVTLVDANKTHVDALNKVGATITGKMNEKNIPVKACLPEEMDGIFDCFSAYKTNSQSYSTSSDSRAYG